MKVNWNDVQRPESSGSFPYRGGTITIRQEEIDVWRARPDALFTVRCFRLWTNKPQYALAGSYWLPNEQREGGTAHTKVTWEDVGCPDGPGTYAFKDGTINVTQQELSIWIEHPSARFTVRSFRPWTGKPQYALGGYELPDERRNIS
jgi:hypothetical protein